MKRSTILETFAVNFVGAFAVTMVALYAMLSPAMAQAVSTVSTVAAGVDFTPLANNMISALAAVATVAAGVLTTFIGSFLKSKTKMNDAAFEALIADRLNAILLKAIDYAEMRAKLAVADPMSPIKNVHIDNVFMEIAVKYAVNAAPDIIAYFKLTNERIADLIRSRLNAYIPTPIANSGIIVATGTDAPSVVVPVSATVATGDITAK